MISLGLSVLPMSLNNFLARLRGLTAVTRHVGVTPGEEETTRDIYTTGTPSSPISNPSVIVGYDIRYAIYVHEDLSVAHHNGQAKFLEQPARAYAQQMANAVAADVLGGMRVEEALLRQARFLKKISQQLVPVDTGALRSSAYIARG